MNSSHQMPPRPRRFTGWSRVGLVFLLPVLFVAVSVRALADGYSPWVRAISIDGEQRFNIYDRVAQALVQNPVYTHDDLSADPSSNPAGFVHSTNMTLAVDLNGLVPVVGSPIQVRVTPTVYINDTPVNATPAVATATVQQWSDPTSKSLMFQVDTPYGVGKHQVYVAWDLATSADGGQSWFMETGDESLHTLYTTLQRPVITRTYFGRRPERGNPWIDFLERSAVWAAGLDNDEDVMAALTRSFWANSDHIYDGGNHSTPTDYNTMDVERFLNPALDPQADCRDMSNFLALLGRSLGLNVTTFRIRGGAVFPSFYWTQYLGPHGGRQPASVVRSTPPNRTRLLTSLNHTWTQTLWNYHQVALYNGKLYDACAMIELQPFVPRNPTNIINHRNLRQTEAAQIRYEYIPDGDYVPNNPDFLIGLTYAEYQPYLVLDEYPFTSASHVEQQGAETIIR